ncbi:plasmid pRiA4b ORF-3 family protein [Methylosinus sporium]|uniref:plasmid pRiA4b ORF-3 family protein n=1 Tax=Methylosinus sporium TaxID=428 RepID=UPI00383A9278
MPFEELNAAQVRIEIAGVSPPIWRRLIVPLSWNLHQLHLAIQAAFNWWNYHLHEFRIGGLRYGDLEIEDDVWSDMDPRVFDEREVRLADFSGEDRIAFGYRYDFGDCWDHTVEIEDKLTLPVSPKHATCVAGARARPPEDVGGRYGYENFLGIISDRKHPEYRETLTWCGGHFDPEWFDLAIVDKDVRSALRPGVKRRLHQPKPRKEKAK